MYWNDPTLYGATMPYKDIYATMPYKDIYGTLPYKDILPTQPFVGPAFNQWQNFPKVMPPTFSQFLPPWQGFTPPQFLNYGQVTHPFLGGFNNFVPPVHQAGMNFGQVPHPFLGGIAPPVQAGNFNPLFNWHRPLI